MVRMCHTLYSQIFQPHWHVFYPKSALWIYNSHFHHKYRSEISFCRPVDSSLQIPISTDETLKNRFLMQTQSYRNCSDLHLAVSQHQSNSPDILLRSSLLIFLYFHDAQMRILSLFSFFFLSVCSVNQVIAHIQKVQCLRFTD